ncbi:methyltransferase domain-containing protein [Comamonas sp. J-3]|uniref:methyltransferase domain-containing protein n=1 Tax=Comamonas trifloxystrobinivorans TaxID=3350256 RepID=UPI00372AAC07
MTQTIQDLHVYLREVREDERTSLSVLASMMHPNATMLDLGCGSGALGQYVAMKQGVTADGITWSSAEADHARPYYRQVEIADLESCHLASMFAGKRYDYIVCADVLEHLRQPENILRQARDMLAPGGQLLISIPNASYSGLIAELIQGEFLYREEGLLDRTHLRFFTRRSLARFLQEQGWQLQVLDTIQRELPDSEFRTRFDSLPPAVARQLLAGNDALSYQLIAAAIPVTQANNQSFVDMLGSTATAQAHFTSELYYASGESFQEDAKLTTRGIIGQSPQELNFRLPTIGGLNDLKLDIADRPGFMHLYSLRVQLPDGEVVWEWKHECDESAKITGLPQHQILWKNPAAAVAPASLMLLSGDDPWIQLRAGHELPADVDLAGATVTASVGWPMSADYMELSETVETTVKRLQLSQQTLQDQKGNLEHKVNQQDMQLTQVRARARTLAEANQSLSEQQLQWQQESVRLNREYNELASHLKRIENSTIFKATRPLVHTKMFFDRLLGRGSALPAQLPTVAAHPISPNKHPVDIIVPVYRGLADTRLCIDSVLSSNMSTPYRLVVINDCSPEPAVTDWLRERAKQDSRILLLENEENLGFVGTVNRGMALSGDNDVLLLNSDTEVANDWLDRIRNAAYSDRKVASVTPFSNNATICSYPLFCKGNDLPPGYTTATLDALCAATNPGAVVDIPTGVGFCMYIRRDSLQEVGLFDTEHFGKGYGEENDFCQRAADKGWRNLHNLDAFVLHTGGVSFGDSKSPREQAAMEMLRKLHPKYEANVLSFLQKDPGLPYRLALDTARMQQAGKPAVLAVSHNRDGGTLRHVYELSEHLQDQAQFLLLTPSPQNRVRLRMASAAEGFDLEFAIPQQLDDLVTTLGSLGVRLVHYHHLLGHDPLVLQLAYRLQVPHVFTAHDYYSFCKHISLSGEKNKYLPEPRLGTCACCKPAESGPLAGTTMSQWRDSNGLLLTAARQVIAPSLDTAQRIRAFAPSANVLAVPHTDLPHLHSLPAPSVPPLAEGENLRIVVLGALSMIKGADVLEAAAMEAAKKGLKIEFHLLGFGYRNLVTQPRAALTVHGAYAEKDLPQLLQWLKPHLVWFPAQWPETYSYTLSACLQQGLPVAVPDIGAFAERVAGREWSWVRPWDETPAQWAVWFEQMRDQHFTPSISPVPPVAPAFSDSLADFIYERDYLQGLPEKPQAQALPLATLASYATRATAANGIRSGALNQLARLRSMPVLRGVARIIPASTQRRVKNWLLK